jgi:hypothetical protein
MKVVPKKIEYNAVEWNGNNIEEIKELVDEDYYKLNHNDKLFIWNRDASTWEPVELSFFVIKKQDDDYIVLSPKVFESYYSVKE